MERNLLVDRLKGYACFLVLFGHVIMGVRVAGIQTPAFLWGLERFIWSFHVALFLFLSGVVYRLTGEWRGKQTKLKFLGYKLYSLGVPYVAFSAVYILINSFADQVNTQSSPGDILLIWKEPVAQYWFLYALFFLFCLWTICSGLLENWHITLGAVLIGYLAPVLGVPLGCLEVVFYSALAFGAGTVLDFASLTKPVTCVKWLVVLLHVAAGSLFVRTGLLESAFIKEFMLLFGICASISLISVLQNCTPVARFLDFMNRYSFQTYLLHTIFTAGIRIILLRLGVGQWWIHVLLGTAFGITCSVLAAKIAKKATVLNWFFFPTKLHKQGKVSAML